MFRGSGNEVVTLHLGPYANYFGAHLWNLDLSRVLCGAPGSGADSVIDSLVPSGSHILFRSAGSPSSAKQSTLTPRAVFCDYTGSVPPPPSAGRAPTLSSVKGGERASGGGLDNSDLHLGGRGLWEGKWDSSYGARSSSAVATELDPAAIADEIAYATSWRGVAQWEAASRSTCVAPASHIIGAQCDVFFDGQRLADATGCGGVAGGSGGGGSGGGGHASVASSLWSLTDGASYQEHIEEALRWHAEDCDRLDAIRIFADSGVY